MNYANVVICLGYGYNILDLGAIFASFVQFSSSWLLNSIDQRQLKLSDRIGALARALALSFYQNVGIAAPSLSLPGTTSGASRSPRLHDDSSRYLMYGSTISAIPLLWMVSGRIVHSCRLTKEVYCLIPASGATSVCPSTSRVTCVLEGVLLDACLAGLQVGHFGHFCGSPIYRVLDPSLDGAQGLRLLTKRL